MDNKRISVPIWAVYLVTALVWPVWAALFVGVLLISDYFGQVGVLQLPALGLGLSIMVALVLSYGLGTLVRSWAPPRLWLVTLAWPALLVAATVVGLVRSDARLISSALSAMAPFAFASLGLLVGLHSASAGEQDAATHM